MPSLSPLSPPPFAGQPRASKSASNLSPPPAAARSAPYSRAMTTARCHWRCCTKPPTGCSVTSAAVWQCAPLAQSSRFAFACRLCSVLNTAFVSAAVFLSHLLHVRALQERQGAVCLRGVCLLDEAPGDVWCVTCDV
jgi:hypothetical protein